MTFLVSFYFIQSIAMYVEYETLTIKGDNNQSKDIGVRKSGSSFIYLISRQPSLSEGKRVFPMFY
jgi:hypothetical protein